MSNSSATPARFPFLTDPMIAVLLVSTVLALVLPAAGEARAAATTISNVGIFVLFLVNGMRIRRSEIAKGLANWRLCCSCSGG
jgi:sodium/bile acid cotransporter 7